MSENTNAQTLEIENNEWKASLKWVIENESRERAGELIEILQKTAKNNGVETEDGRIISDYINSIPPDQEERYPGDLEMEQKILSAIRWNAMAIVANANKKIEGIGGHISTYSSAAHLYEIGFNHFFKGYDDDQPDLVYFQGHASPGIYARSFVEHRLTEESLKYFRQETQNKAGLSSYPHPRLMPEYWRFPTVSMGLSPIQAIYQARYLKYLENRGLKKKNQQKVWAFLGDGEMDEPESTGALSIAAREKLDNLIFVINCNLQRLDGPVRGNKKIINELEGLFKGAQWNTIKVIWGKSWDQLFEKDNQGHLKNKLNSIIDGELQRFNQADGKKRREEFFNTDEKLKELVKDLDDKELKQLIPGGHDFNKVYNAYQKASQAEGGPTVILAQTVKGFGQGSAGEASNVTHKTKKFKKDEVKAFRDYLDIPVSDKALEKEIPYYRFKKNSKEYKYLTERRKKLQGTLPERKQIAKDFKTPEAKSFNEFNDGSDGKEVTTTAVFVKVLTNLLKDKNLKDAVVPIIPDEARTFGMDSLYRTVGIYAAQGQKYEPVDKGSLLFYNEDKKGVILEEGITEAGSMGSFMAAGTTHMSQTFYAVPFYIFYSMFGFQRVGDFIWAAADARVRGFLLGGISGKSSLSGEGLQHADGYSHLNALAVPSIQAYDPAFAFELALIIRDGIQRMYKDDEDIFYYITLGNQSYAMPAMPKGVKDGVLDGAYLFRKSGKRKNKKLTTNLMGSGSVMKEVLEAAEIIEKQLDIPVNIWSVTSYKKLYDDILETENDGRKKKSLVEKTFEGNGDLFVAVTDFVKALPLCIANEMPGDYIVLGTDGFGHSDSTPALRKHFNIDANHIAETVAKRWVKKGEMDKNKMKGIK